MRDRFYELNGVEAAARRKRLAPKDSPCAPPAPLRRSLHPPTDGLRITRPPLNTRRTHARACILRPRHRRRPESSRPSPTLRARDPPVTLSCYSHAHTHTHTPAGLTSFRVSPPPLPKKKTRPRTVASRAVGPTDRP